MRVRWRLGAVLAAVVLAAGCSGTSTGSVDSPEPAPGDAAGHADDGDQHAADDGEHATGEGGHGDEQAAGHRDAQRTRSEPLRSGERFTTLAMPAAYDPSAPLGTGTDDYRCFVLDPKLAEDAFLTGIDVLPGTEDVVHHVILFRVPPESLATARAKDAAEDGQGWTCFGGTGVDSGAQLDDAPWLGAWAPGGGESVFARDVGVPLEADSQVIMQVHYNLRAGPEPDVTSARLRLASGEKDLDALETMLLPAPVELPCRPGHAKGRLCDRANAVADVVERVGGSGNAANVLHLLCGQQPAGKVQSCDRTIRAPATIRAAAGHMHLLGRSIRVEVNPDTPQARTVLDIPVWDFDNQGAKPVEAHPLGRGDVVRVTCEHDQALRDVLPAFEGQGERWVVWGEGTTDEMCLGMLLVTRP
ncbi:hypothetical protein BH18ACT9_BH18ACT9_06190 [soil metagenome]